MERKHLLDEVLPNLENVFDEGEAQRSAAFSRSLALVQIVRFADKIATKSCGERVDGRATSD